MSEADLTGAAHVITDTWRRWEGYQPRLERNLFATTHPSSIVAAVDAFCRARLGSGIASYEFYSVGVGSTHGLRLTDGRRVVVKVHRATTDVAHLAAVHMAKATWLRPGSLRRSHSSVLHLLPTVSPSRRSCTIAASGRMPTSRGSASSSQAVWPGRSNSARVSSTCRV